MKEQLPMPNGLLSAKSRRDHNADQSKRRLRFGRRLMTIGLILSTGLPGDIRISAQESSRPAAIPAGAFVDADATLVSPVARAIAVGQANDPSGVALTAGGFLGQSSTGKKKDDGRKAYPLPPPDPSTVNWNGVPYHAPKPGSIAASSSATDQPIRDALPGARSNQSPAPARTQTAQPSGSSAPSPRPESTDQSPRIASAAPVQRPKMPVAGSQGEFSTSSSSRRSGRRQIDPLNPDELLSEIPESQAATANTDGSDYPSIGKREIAVETSNVANVSSKTAPSPAMAANVPPSLSGSAPIPETSNLPTLASPGRTPAESIPEIPDPVSRTQPMVPAKNSTAYSPQSIAGQLSPLHPVSPSADLLPDEPSEIDDFADDVEEEIVSEESDWSDSEAADEEFLGSGIATNSDDAEEAEEESEIVDAQTVPSVVPSKNPVTPIEPLSTRRTIVGDPGTGSVDPAASSKRTVASELPGIRVVTEGPSEVLIRKLTQYEVRVENRGSIDATGVVVRTALPPWAEVVGHNVSIGLVKPLSVDAGGQIEWTLESLPAGVVERLFIRIKATKPGTFDVATNWTTLPQTHSAQVTVREPKLAVEIEGPDEIIYGKSQKYRVRVMNPGDGLASNVVFMLAPDADDSVKQPLGNLPAGKEASFEIELTARDQGELKIHGAAMADLDLAASTKKSVSVASAKIDAVLSGPPLKFQNTDASYQLQLKNVGRATAESIEAAIHVPAGMKYLGGIEGGRIEGDRLVWTIPSLAPGETLDYKLDYAMELTGNHQLTFQCNGTAAARANVSLETSVQAIVDLKLAVFDPPAPASVGSEVTYEVVIHNRGSKAAEDVRVVAQFGHGIEPVRVDGLTGDVVTGQVIFKPIARIEAGSQVKLKIIAKADQPGDHRFRAEVRSGETVLVAEEATVFVDVKTERVSRSSSSEIGNR
jgi:hypothetical protein